MHAHLVAPLAFACLCAIPAAAADYAADPDTYRTRVDALRPGDRLALAAGTYEGLTVSGLEGTAEAPIVIEGPAEGPRAVIGGRACCNTISIADAAFVVLRHLDVDNRGLDVDGLKAEGTARFAHHITVEDLRIFNFGDSQQLVGISTKCPAWDWTIRSTVIEAAGTGLYLGNSDGSAPFVRGVIERNLIVDPKGYALQIKHQGPRPEVPGLPQGDSVTLIRDNVFTKADRASHGADARPSVLVGHFPVSGPGADDRYEIFGNFFHQNASGTEALFQGEGHLAFHDNVLVNTFGPGVRVQPQNDAVKSVALYDNTIFVAGEGIVVTGGDPAWPQDVVGNAVFAGEPLRGGAQRDNVVAPFEDAGAYVVSPGATPGLMDFYPGSGGGLEGEVIDRAPFAIHAAWDRDFNGTLKSGRFRGAYSGSGENPGWTLAVARKAVGAGSAARDGGLLSDAAGAADATDTNPVADARVSRDAGAPAPADGDGDARDAAGSQTPDRSADAGCACRSAHGPGTRASFWGLFLVLGLARHRPRAPIGARPAPSPLAPPLGAGPRPRLRWHL